MLILGIDPGTATTGWGVVQIQNSEFRIKNSNGRRKKNNNIIKLLGYGCILTDPEEEMPNRLLVLRKELKKVLINFSPNELIAERLFFGANSKTAMAVGQARGIIMLTAAETKTPFFEYTGLQVKLEVANHGRADKKTVQDAVIRMLGVPELPKPKDQSGKEVNRFRDDAYDAVAVALCHLSKTNLIR